MIHVFLDGSARGDFASYTGVYGDPSAITAFAHLWSICLRKHGLSFLRATEAMTFNGEFAHKRDEWGQEFDARRTALLFEFVHLYKLTGLGSSAFSVNIHGLPEKQQALQKRRLFQQVVGQALAGIDEKYPQVALICDTEQDAADHFRKWLDNLYQRDKESPRCLARFR